MPGPLRERDANAAHPRPSSLQLLNSIRPKSQLSHQRLPDDQSPAVAEPEVITSPHFMADTTASSSRCLNPATSGAPAPKPRRIPTPHSLLTLGALAAKHSNPEHANGCEVSPLSAGDDTRLAPTDPSSLPTASPARPSLDKPLPSRPFAQVVSTSPYRESRTLIDASEQPLRRSAGTPDEEDWPTLSPLHPSNSAASQAFSHRYRAWPSEASSPTMEAGRRRRPAAGSPERATIKILPTDTNDDSFSAATPPQTTITPSSQPLSLKSYATAGNDGGSTSSAQETRRAMKPLRSQHRRVDASENTAFGCHELAHEMPHVGQNSAQGLSKTKPRLVDIQAPKGRHGPRTPGSTNGSIPRPAAIPRPTGHTQGHSPRHYLQDPQAKGYNIRGYPRISPKAISRGQRSSTSGMSSPAPSINGRKANSPCKRSVIPVPSRNGSPQTVPPGPAVFTLKAKVSAQSSLDAKSLSTIESVDTGHFDPDADENRVMRPGPQRRATLSQRIGHFKHLSASTVSDPTSPTKTTTTTTSRPSSRTESSRWVETENSAGTRTKRLSSGGQVSEYGPTLTISPDADELIMGRKATPSPPVPAVPPRAAGHKNRNLHRMAVTNELRKASANSGVSGTSLAKERHAASNEPFPRQSSAGSIQPETFTVQSSGEKNGCHTSSLENYDAFRRLSANRLEASPSEDAERLRAVCETLARLEGGYEARAGGSELDEDIAAPRALVVKDRTSPPSARSSDIFRNGQLSHKGNLTPRSTSGNSIASAGRARITKRDPSGLQRSSSVISIASSRPPVPAKDSRPPSKAPIKAPSIQKRSSAASNGSTGLRSPYGLSAGVSATPSNIPQPFNSTISPRRFSPTNTLTTSRSTSGEKRSISRAKLTMSGFRGLFHKKGDSKGFIKTGEKKKRSNVKVSSTGSPMPELSGKSTHRTRKASSGRSVTPTHKALPKHSAEYLAESPPLDIPEASEIVQSTALVMHITSLARKEQDDDKKCQLLSIAKAMLGAVESAKHAKIAVEHAEQAAREANLHQEMARQSLIAINKIISISPGAAAALVRGGLRISKRRSSTIGR